MSGLYSVEFCALDLETTGINPFMDRAVEIGIVKFNLNGVIDRYETLINPGMHIPEGVVSIHGISDEMVENAPPFGKVVDEITSFIGGRPLVIQNPRFDISFLEMEYKRCFKSIPQWVSYDTVTIARKAFPGLDNYKLTTLCRYFSIKTTSHRALFDSEACMQVFINAVKKNDPEKIWGMTELNSYCGKTESTGIIREFNSRECKGGYITVGVPATIVYTDGEGNTTERRILPRKIFRRGKQTIVFAYCYLREENRCFKIGRIERVI